MHTGDNYNYETAEKERSEVRRRKTLHGVSARRCQAEKEALQGTLPEKQEASTVPSH